MENEDRIKALNILFASSGASILISAILSFIVEAFAPGNNRSLIIAIMSPVITYIVGRIMCFKEYKDETT